MDYGVLSQESIKKIEKDVNNKLKKLEASNDNIKDSITEFENDENNTEYKVSEAMKNILINFKIHVDNNGQIMLTSCDKFAQIDQKPHQATLLLSNKLKPKQIVLKTSLSLKNIRNVFY